MRITTTYYANIRNLSGEDYIVVNIDKNIPNFELKKAPHYHYGLLTKDPSTFKRVKAKEILQNLEALSMRYGGADIILCSFKKIDPHRAQIALFLYAHVGHLLEGHDIVELPQAGRVVQMAA